MKKKIVSVLITIMFISTIIIIITSYFASRMFVEGIIMLPTIIIGIALAVIGALVYTAIERIREIKEEKDSDISKY